MGSKQKPLIGITRSRRRGNIMTWLNRLAIWRAGGRSVVFEPGDMRTLSDLDGVLIGGGDDLNPTLYGGDVTLDVAFDDARDALETRILDHALKNHLPVLGICRGSQLLNVYLGGTLHQDIHKIYTGAPRLRTVLPKKRVTTRNGTRLNQLLNCDDCRVNSLHHQSVNQLGENMRVAANDEHGMVQAIETRTDAFIIGVQWHPEMLIFDRGQQNVFRALVSAA